MRVIFVLTATAVIAIGLFFTIKVPNTRDSERLLVSYNADPKKTLKRVEAAIFECVPGSGKSVVGAKYTGPFIAPLYIKVVSLRMEKISKDTMSARLQNWIKTNHPKMLTDVPDKDLLELLSYSEAIADDDVENCILSSAA